MHTRESVPSHVCKYAAYSAHREHTGKGDNMAVEFSKSCHPRKSLWVHLARRITRDDLKARNINVMKVFGITGTYTMRSI